MLNTTPQLIELLHSLQSWLIDLGTWKLPTVRSFRTYVERYDLMFWISSAAGWIEAEIKTFCWQIGKFQQKTTEPFADQHPSRFRVFNLHRLNHIQKDLMDVGNLQSSYVRRLQGLKINIKPYCVFYKNTDTGGTATNKPQNMKASLSSVRKVSERMNIYEGRSQVSIRLSQKKLEFWWRVDQSVNLLTRKEGAKYLIQ